MQVTAGNMSGWDLDAPRKQMPVVPKSLLARATNSSTTIHYGVQGTHLHLPHSPHPSISPNLTASSTNPRI